MPEPSARRVWWRAGLARCLAFIGLSLLSYAVNLFIFVMGWVRGGRAPFVEPGKVVDAALFADPLPQALVLTAIVISFAMTALLLVVLLAARGLTGTDHVDGREPDEHEL